MTARQAVLMTDPTWGARDMKVPPSSLGQQSATEFLPLPWMMLVASAPGCS